MEDQLEDGGEIKVLAVTKPLLKINNNPSSSHEKCPIAIKCEIYF